MMSNVSFTNLSSHNPSVSERCLLGSGLTFIPTPAPQPTPVQNLTGPVNNGPVGLNEEIGSAFQRLRRNVAFRLPHQGQLRNWTPVRRLRVPNPSYVPAVSFPSSLTQGLKNLEANTRHAVQVVSRTTRNTTPASLQAFKNLAANKDLRICQADKNLGTVLVDEEWYKGEGKRQLSDKQTYVRVTTETADTMFLEAKEKIDTLVKGKMIGVVDKQTRQYILHYTNAAFEDKMYGYLYFLIKVHKGKPYKGRPVVASHRTLTSSLSKALSRILRPYVDKIPHILKDSKSLVQDLEKRAFWKDCVLGTADVESLYPSIPTYVGIERVCTLLLKKLGCPRKLVGAIREGLRIVLKYNLFTFGCLDNSIWHQICGTAMGTPCAPEYANLFLASFELSDEFPALSRTHGVLYYKRYIDDVKAICRSKADWNKLLKHWNSVDPGQLKLTGECSDLSIDFLDLTIFKGPKFRRTHRFDFKLFVKPMNRFLYTPFSSYHTTLTKLGWIKGELIRIIRNSSDRGLYLHSRREFFHNLRARGYPHSFLIRAFTQTNYNSRPSIMSASTEAKGSRQAPLVITLTHRPEYIKTGVTKLLKQGWSEMLREDPSLGLLVPKAPVIAWKNQPNLLAKVRRALIRDNRR